MVDHSFMSKEMTDSIKAARLLSNAPSRISNPPGKLIGLIGLGRDNSVLMLSGGYVNCLENFRNLNEESGRLEKDSTRPLEMRMSLSTSDGC